eukprot:419317_1
MSSNHLRQSSKRLRHDTDLDPYDEPPLKRIKLGNLDREETSIHSGLLQNKFKWLSKNMNTIFNYSQRPKHDARLKINEVIRPLFLTHIMNDDGTHISSTFKKLLQEFYDQHTVKFVDKWYRESRIYKVCNGWYQYDTPCMTFIDVLRNAIVEAHEKTDVFESRDIRIRMKSELIGVYKNQQNKNMNRINESTQMLIANGYIRHNAGNLDIPECISHVVSLFYEPLSFRCKMSQLFENEVNKIAMNMHMIENNAHVCETLDRLAQMFPMLHESYSEGDSFYTNDWKAVEKIIRALNDVWNKQYLLNQIGIMEYTNRIEIFMEKSKENYPLEQQAGVGILIPSFNRCILDKNGGDYNTLVTVLNRSQLKRIYRVFLRMNSGEAGTLRAVYKRAH